MDGRFCKTAEGLDCGMVSLVEDYRTSRKLVDCTSDKHKYYPHLSEVHPVSFLLTGQSTLVERIPDATFGLATFRERQFQSRGYTNELVKDHLQALMVHRSTGLVSDPKLGETDLVFPFAVYEAKACYGSARSARQQACAAAAHYLDMLDTLARRPDDPTLYQDADSATAQVFAVVSHGPYWYIMVGYRRPRSKREHASHKGLSDTVYVSLFGLCQSFQRTNADTGQIFQRIWSGCVDELRNAWRLLSLIDQIHEWGVTKHRAFVIRHLTGWHRYCQQSYAHDVNALLSFEPHQWPKSLLQEIWTSPDWVKSLPRNRGKQKTQMQRRLKEILDAARVNQAQIERREYTSQVICQAGRCGKGTYPGFPVSKADATKHVRDFHMACFSVEEREGSCKSIERVIRSSEEEEVQEALDDLLARLQL